MSPTTVSGYGLQPPVAHEAVASLERLLGPDEARRVWDSACVAARVRVNGTPLSVDQLTAVADQLKTQSGLASIVGNSLSVRLRTYKNLQNK